MLKQYSAGVVIYRTDEKDERSYLLLQYPRGPLDFPKGKLYDGEAWRTGALREAYEETGIQLELHQTFEHFYRYTFNDSRGNKIEKTVMFFIAKVPFDQNVVLSEEHVDYFWFKYDQARLNLQFENIKYLLDQVDQFLDVTVQ